MEAESARDIPTGPEWEYEPKWDGFRCLAFRDDDEINVMSKSGQALARYFPEIVEALLKVEAKKFVLDGELVLIENQSLSFDSLLQRIHPAASRIRKLAAQTPATFMVFDILVDGDGADLTKQPLNERRAKLELFSRNLLKQQDRIRLSPRTDDFAVAKNWFYQMAGPLDGVIAKRTDRPYDAAGRKSMLKIKNLRSADCVVGGFRYGSGEPLVGSLLLGLYDNEGRLHHVGFTSGLAKAEKPELTKKLEALIEPPGFTGAKPGGPSRWSTERSAEWKPLATKLVVEVQYDHFSGYRFRHGTKLIHWRPDKQPASCTLQQVERESQSPLTLLD
jgi:ATP-dependent DNA ligase